MPANVQFYEVSRHELGRDTGETLRAAYRQFVALYPPPMFGDGANLIMQWKRDAALQSPPPREADTALWPLVEEWAVAHREWMAPHGHSLDGPEYRRYDEARTALLAYRPPSAPAPAVTSEGPWPMTIKTHFWCPECKGPCCVDEDALCSQCGADVVASGTPEAAALSSPPPQETQP